MSFPVGGSEESVQVTAASTQPPARPPASFMLAQTHLHHRSSRCLVQLHLHQRSLGHLIQQCLRQRSPHRLVLPHLVLPHLVLLSLSNLDLLDLVLFSPSQRLASHLDLHVLLSPHPTHPRPARPVHPHPASSAHSACAKATQHQSSTKACHHQLPSRPPGQPPKLIHCHCFPR